MGEVAINPKISKGHSILYSFCNSIRVCRIFWVTDSILDDIDYVNIYIYCNDYYTCRVHV